MGYSYKDTNLSISTSHALKCTASKLPINKEIVKVGIDSRTIANKVKYSDNSQIVITKPILDRLVIKFDIKKHINDITYGSNMDYEHVTSGINSYLVMSAKDDTDTLYQSVTMEEKCNQQNRFSGYKKNIWLIYPKTGARILVQTTPVGNKAFMRFDFNPDDLGKAGIQFLKDEFLSIMGGNVSWEFLSQFKGAIQRMDIAVDFIGLDPSWMFVHRDKAPHQKHECKANVIESETGRHESIYYNYKEGSSSDTYLYNKKKEQLKKVGKAEYKEALHARFETRIHTALSLDELVGLKNHLKKFKIHAIDFNMLLDIHFSHVLVAEKALLRGLDKALEIIPEGEKPMYEQSYKDAVIALWDHEALWSHWPDLLKSYGLLK